METMKATEIIKQGLAHGESYDLINERLKQAGFDFHLEKSRPEGWTEGWTEEEIKSGFIPADSETPDALHLVDLMKRDMQNANKEIQVSCAEGYYKITYNADGYAVKAVKLNV